jgi:hypothetical protein
MDEVARLRPRDRADLFNEAARLKTTLRAEVIEKDFWVCWVLRAVFSLPSPPAEMIFKGGTSLSKVHKAIDRFSEDVDLSFDRSALGYGGDHDPAKGPTNKNKKKRLDGLKAACQIMIRERFRPMLEKCFADKLGTPPGPETWTLSDKADDPDNQTLLFKYPKGLASSTGSLSYVQPLVRLEMGARGDQWPASDVQIRPYVAELLPDLRVLNDSTVLVRALAAERTFWEKATILHKLFHCPPHKPLQDKQSRHYYDVVKLYQNGIGKSAVADLDLLRKVSEHQKVFFACSWAKFDEALPGTLRLLPAQTRLSEIKNDYEVMRQEMIFGEAPTLQEIFDVLAEIENEVNSTT